MRSGHCADPPVRGRTTSRPLRFLLWQKSPHFRGLAVTTKSPVALGVSSSFLPSCLSSPLPSCSHSDVAWHRVSGEAVGAETLIARPGDLSAINPSNSTRPQHAIGDCAAGRSIQPYEHSPRDVFWNA